MGASQSLIHRTPFTVVLVLALTHFLPLDFYARTPEVRLGHVVVSGNAAFSNRQIEDLIPAVEGGLVYDSLLRNSLDAIAGYYHAEGYLRAIIRGEIVPEPDDTLRANMRVYIEEGPLCIAERVNFEGNAAYPSDMLLDRMETQPGSVVRQSTILADLDAIVTLYENSGYPFASAVLSRLESAGGPSSGTMTVTIGVTEGARVVVRGFDVKGATTTDPAVIVRETGIRAGDLFDQREVNAVPRRVSRLGIFSAVELPVLRTTSDGGILSLHVSEGNPNTFDGILGYVPSGSAGEKGYLTGLVNISMRNLFGTARRAQVRWQREDRRSQEIALRYTEPWAFGLPIEASVAFLQRQQDTTYIRRAYDMAASIRIADGVRIGATIQAQSVIPSATRSGRTVPSSGSTLAGLEVLIDSREDALTPTTGVLFRNGIAFGAKRVDGDQAKNSPGSTSAVQRIHLDVESYVPAARTQVVALTVHGRQVTSGELDRSDLYLLGGTSTLRGYRENQFQGTRIAWSSAEYRFLLGRRSFFFGFIDGGYYYIPDISVDGTMAQDGWKMGYGFGIRLDTGIGLLGLSVALANGEALGQAKIHVAMVNEF